MLRKIYRRRIIGFVVICFLLYPEISIHAQSIDYYSEEQILTLFHNREYKALIPILISYTNQIEEHGITQDGVFSDTVYSGLIGLLVPSLLQNGEFRAADECLSKAILFLKKSNCSPNAIYPLYVSQGAIYNILGDYALESTCFSEAIKYLKMNDQYSMEQLFVIQGMLAASYRDQGELKLAKDVVDQILPTIQEIEFSSCNPVSVLNTAATIYAESGLTQEAKKILKKTMSICSQDSSLISEYIQTATNLTILYTNIGEYKQALDLTLETTKLPMTAIEKQRFYSNIPSLAYYLGEEDLACEYAKLNSDILIRNIFSIQHSFSSIKPRKKLMNN